MGRLYLYRSCLWYVRRLRACVVNSRECRLNAPAAAFFNTIREHHFDAETYIDVLPQHRLIYLCVPKAASTTIRSILSSLEVGTPPGPALELLYNRRCTGIRSPRLAGFSVFHRLTKSAETLRFTFVRNPYAVESFQTHLARVLEHIGVTKEARARHLQLAVNPSSHQAWQDYYTDALARRVYRAYERDFDKFAYQRTIK